ncbi:MAG TPA: SBBP repeat-containing protein [Candidatus Brocadiia bacterium]|nr:SBBP repeat-containing protein [Candidatus Brocadiia bacterium]
MKRNQRVRVFARSSSPAIERLEDRLLLGGGGIEFPNDTGDADPAAAELAVQSMSALPATFIENGGQVADDSVRFVLQGNGTNVYLADDGITFTVFESANGRANPVEDLHTLNNAAAAQESLEFRAASFTMTLGNGATPLAPVGSRELPGVVNYFRGNDPDQWQTGMRTYSEVTYEDVYPGVDLVLWGTRSNLKYEFRLDPGADPGVIQVDCADIDSLSLDADGNLLIQAGGFTLVDDAPYVYQVVDGAEREIPARFVLLDEDSWTIEVDGQWDKSLPLVLDPEIEWSTYLGGGGYDLCRENGAAVDYFGNVYVTGLTFSTDFPSTGGLDTGSNGSCDVFITKIRSDGSEIVWSTYLGGGGEDQGQGIAVDASENVYVTGVTTSTDFPVRGGFDTSLAGASDSFVTKIKADGSDLAWSTYLGGGGGDQGESLVVDTLGDVYVTGDTSSSDFPVPGGVDTTLGGSGDAFVARIKNDGKDIVWATYLGGSGSDVGTDVFISNSGDVSVTGWTSSSDFPIQGGLDTAINGYIDAFVTKITSDGSHIVWSTYVGGSSDDRGSSIAVDDDGDVYITGHTGSADFPTQNGLEMSINGYIDAFVTKITSNGSHIVWSTYVGGSSDDRGSSIAVDDDGDVYITGHTGSADFPTQGGFDTSINGGHYYGDAFVTKIDLDGARIAWSTYLGGANDDTGQSIVISGSGNVYVTGWTNASDFPVPDGFDRSFNGNHDTFVTKITQGSVDNIPPESFIDSPGDGTTIDPGQSINLAGSGTDSDGSIVAWAWLVTGPGGFNQVYAVQDPGNLTLNTPGTYTVTLTVTDDDYAPDPTPAIITVTVNTPGNNPPNGIIDSPLGGTTIDPMQAINLQGSGTDSDGNIVAWAWLITGPSGFTQAYVVQDPGNLTLNTPGLYTVTLTVTDDDLTVDPTPAIVRVTVNTPGNNAPNGFIDSPVDGTTIDPGQAINLGGTGFDSDGAVIAYAWLVTGPGGFNQAFAVGDPGNLTLNTPGIYTVTLTVTDNDLAIDPTPAIVTVTVRSTGSNTPNGYIDSPTDGTEIAIGGSINLQGTASDPDGTIASHAWFILGPGPGSGGLPIFIANYETADPGSITLPNAGYYTIIYAVTDNDGNTDSTPAQVSVKVGSPTNVPPNGTITSPIDGTVINPGGKVNLASSATDSDGAVIMHVWTGFGPGGFAANPQEDPTYLMQNPGEVQLDAPGEYFFRYIPIDNGFQPDPSPALVKVRVNSPPESFITSPLDGASVVSGSAINLQGTATDDSGISIYNWQVTGPGGFSRSFNVEDPGNLTLTALGEYTINFRATDNSGVVDPTPASITVTVIVPNLPPDGTIDSPSDESIINPGGNILLQGSGTDPDGTISQWDWHITGPGGFSRSYNVEDPGSLVLNTKGDYVITLTVTDDKGLSDPTPAIVTVAVEQLYILLGKVSTSGGDVYVFDTDGPDTGFAIDGDYDETDGTKYNPYAKSNDLMIVGTPGGVVILANAWVNNGTWQRADFSGLGIVVDGYLATFVDQRMGTGDIAFISSTNDIGTVVVKSGLTGLPGSDLDIPGVGVIPAGTALNAGGDIATAVIYGDISGNVNADDLGTLIVGRNMSGDLTLAGAAKMVYTGFQTAGTMSGSVTAAKFGTLYVNGVLSGPVDIVNRMELLYATGNVTAPVEAGWLNLFYTKGSLSGSLNAGILPTVIAGTGISGPITTLGGALTILSQSGDITGDIGGIGGFTYIGAPQGAISAKIASMGNIGTVFAGKAFTGRIETPALFGTLIAESVSKSPATRALIQAENGITSIVVRRDMTDCDVGVGLNGSILTTPARIGSVYVGGNMLRSNIVAGAWWNAAMPYSDGAAAQAWLNKENASIGTVYVGMSIGNGEAGAWGIGSSGDIAYIADSAGPLLRVGINTATRNNYEIKRG